MAFSPPGAETPQSLRDSNDVVRVQFVAGATPSDAQPPLEEPEIPVRHEPKSRLGVLEARLAALEADRGPRRRKKKAAAVEKQESVVDDDEEANDGFLLAFLVAGGVDAPRAVRAAGRLRLRGSYASSQAFATIPAATLQQAGLRAHEIRATLRAARGKGHDAIEVDHRGRVRRSAQAAPRAARRPEFVGAPATCADPLGRAPSKIAPDRVACKNQDLVQYYSSPSSSAGIGSAGGHSDATLDASNVSNAAAGAGAGPGAGAASGMSTSTRSGRNDERGSGSRGASTAKGAA